MIWNKAAGVEGELGRFRMQSALCTAPWAFSLPPIPGALLSLCWAQSFLPAPVSHPRPLGEESTVSGLTAQQAAGEEAPSCPWPQHPVISSSAGPITGWCGLCPLPPHRAGTSPSQRAREQEGASWGKGLGERRQPDEGRSLRLLVSRCQGGAAGPPGAGPTCQPHHCPWHFFIRLCLVSVLCCPVCVCWIHVLCSLLLVRPRPAIAPDPRPSCGAAKAPRTGPSHCCWTSLSTCR